MTVTPTLELHGGKIRKILVRGGAREQLEGEDAAPAFSRLESVTS